MPRLQTKSPPFLLCAVWVVLTGRFLRVWLSPTRACKVPRRWSAGGIPLLQSWKPVVTAEANRLWVRHFR